MKLIMENWRKHLNEAIELSYQPLSNEQIFELAGLDETEKGIMRQGLWPSPAAWPPELDGALDKLVNWFAYDVRDHLDLEPGSEAEIHEWMPTWVASDGDPDPWIEERLTGGNMRWAGEWNRGEGHSGPASNTSNLKGN